MEAVLSTMKHTTSTIQKYLAKDVKNCVPKKVIPKGMKNTKKCVTKKVIPKDMKRNTKKCVTKKVIPDVKNCNGDESFHGEQVKNTIQKCAIKKVISKGKMKCRRMMSNITGSASMKKRHKTKFTKGGNDRQERRWKRRQNKILIRMLKASSMLVSAMEEVSRLDEKPDKC